jgi:hypothetical protein
MLSCKQHYSVFPSRAFSLIRFIPYEGTARKICSLLLTSYAVYQEKGERVMRMALTGQMSCLE